MMLHREESVTIARLQERAEQCRRLARQALSHGIAVELERLAHDYERDAARLEQWVAPLSSAAAAG
jgi:hypothetical protein